MVNFVMYTLAIFLKKILNVVYKVLWFIPKPEYLILLNFISSKHWKKYLPEKQLPKIKEILHNLQYFEMNSFMEAWG